MELYGAPWRDLPDNFAPYTTCYNRFVCWRRAGVWDQLRVDVARFGDDRSVIVLRRGRDARSVSWIKLTGADTMTVAAKVAEIAQQYRPDAIFIDGGGPGGGVVDRLRQLQHSVFDVQFGGKADHSHIGQDGAIVYANKRAEMWGAMRAWLAGAANVQTGQLIEQRWSKDEEDHYRKDKPCPHRVSLKGLCKEAPHDGAESWALISQRIEFVIQRIQFPDGPSYSIL